MLEHLFKKVGLVPEEPRRVKVKKERVEKAWNEGTRPRIGKEEVEEEGLFSVAMVGLGAIEGFKVSRGKMVMKSGRYRRGLVVGIRRIE